MNKITGTIITLNEARHITDCIKSLFMVCDEVIVVDSMSKDDTVELARQAGAKVYLQPYQGDGPQKIHTEQLATHDWVLNIDADERLDEDMVAYINNLDLLSGHYDGYAFRRKNFVGQHWIKAASFYPDYVVRLYNRTRTGYLPRKRHAYVDAKSVCKSRKHLLHYTYENYADWIKRINVLSDIDARFMYEEGIRVSRWKPVSRAFAAAVRKLIFKGGLFQGVDGFTVSLTTVFRTYMKYVKLQEIYDKQNTD